MTKTYPNQKVIHIMKKKYFRDFLQIGIKEWEKAFQDLSKNELGLYLYLSSNADGYDLTLSPALIEEELGIKRTSYHDSITKLKKLGYLVKGQQDGVCEFYTTPIEPTNKSFNQKVFHINRSKYNKDFLQISIKEWKQAFNDMPKSVFGLYLYLSSNADGYNLALSYEAVKKELGISKSSYDAAVDKLKELNYLVLHKGNIYNFYTTPTVEIKRKPKEKDTTTAKLKDTQPNGQEFLFSTQLKKSENLIEKQIINKQIQKNAEMNSSSTASAKASAMMNHSIHPHTNQKERIEEIVNTAKEVATREELISYLNMVNGKDLDNDINRFVNDLFGLYDVVAKTVGYIYQFHYKDVEMSGKGLFYALKQIKYYKEEAISFYNAY